MPNNLQKAQELVDQYLELQVRQDTLKKEVEDLKKVIAKFSADTNQKLLKSGNTILKVRQFERTSFPKIDDPDRKAVEDIMRQSKEWKQAITFNIIKLGLAYDKKKLSENLMDKLEPYTDKEEVIRVTKSKLKYKKKAKYAQKD